MTNQPRTRFIALLTAEDPQEGRRVQAITKVMTNAFWLASATGSTRLAEVIDLRRRTTPLT